MFYHESQDPKTRWDGYSLVALERGKECNTNWAEAFVRATRYGEIKDTLPELAKFLIPTPFSLPRGHGVGVDPKKIGL